MKKPQRFDFKSEALLQQAIAGLLARMPHITEIQLLQGPLEYGKDIVFKHRGPFDEVTGCACVIKNTKITGRLTGSSSASVVLNQARQALSRSYTDGSGGEVVIQRVFVITPSTISPHAIESISGQLRERAGQVRFIAGEELLRLYQVYWPDFLADEALALHQYADKLNTALHDQYELRRLSTLYPAAGIARIHAGIRIPTGFCLVYRAYSLARVKKQIVPDGFFEKSFSSDDLHRVMGRLESLQALIAHVTRWGFTSEDMRRILDEKISSLLEVMGRSWSRGSGAASSRSLVTSEKSTVPESRFLDGHRELAQMIADIQAGIRASVRELDAGLLQGRALAQEATSRPTAISRNAKLLAYTHASSCLEAYGPGWWQGGKASAQLHELNVPEEVLDSCAGVVLVVAPAGFGKTSFCRWRALEDLRRWRGDDAACLPIYIRLSTIEATGLTSTRELLESGLHTAFLADRDWNAVLRRKVPVRVYLDGLDEVTSSDSQARIIECAKQCSQEHPHWTIIVTSRDYIRAPWLGQVPRIQLRGFSIREVEKLATAILAGQPELVKRLLRQLQENTNLLALAQVPLLATLMIMIFATTGDLPSKKAAIYMTFTDLLCGGWDFVKNVQRESAFGRELKTAVLSRLAWAAHEARVRAIDDETVREVCRSAAPFVFCIRGQAESEEAIEQFEQDVLADGLLSRTGNQWEFIHLSFQEFMVGKWLSHGAATDTAEAIVIRYLRGDDWWGESIAFFLALSPDPERAADWLQSVSRKVDGGVNQEVRMRRMRLFATMRSSFPELMAGRA